ncbi:MAG: hemolysin III family protein [Mycobacterium sp.]|uniref:PAQR family membrane homeostasis protein TrhA n=1 Tax=Mycobacterium sp. TaxID=1785 RepID=UPI003C59EB65
MVTYRIDAAGRSIADVPTDDVDDIGRLTESDVSVLRKPRLRGWIHLYCAFAALIAGPVLVAVSWAVESKQAGHATLAYTLAIVTMFAVSATYHRVDWGSVSARSWMRRLDHSMIFVLIAGTYTPFALLDMPRSTGQVVLAIVWGGALAGIALTLFWPDAPRWLGVALYLLLGWVAVWYAGAILHNAGVAAGVLLAVGGALYSVGAVFYAVRWPDPWPATFGYHEIFHACTAVAAICQFVAVCIAVF